MKRKLGLVLAIMMLLVMAVGCASQESQPQDQDDASSAQDGASSDQDAASSAQDNESSAQDDASDVVMNEDEVMIGISVGDLRLERWQKDVNLMKAKALEMGVKEENIIVANANADENAQNAQCSDLITKGVDVLIIVPQNGETMGPVVNEAHEAGIKVIAYERLFMNCDLDYIVSFDNYAIGVAQAQSLIDIRPEGNYFLLCGSPTDNNATIYHDGQMEVIQPYIDNGDIKLVGEQWVKNWDTDEAFKIVENALTASDNEIDVIVASNDSTAQGAVQAFVQQGLVGEILVSGQDADLVSCQYIAEGKQTTTIYKPLKNLASTAIQLALQVVKGEAIDVPMTINNGKVDVPAIQLEVVTVTKDNIMDTIIADGFQDYDEVYKNVPEDERP